MEEQQRAPPHCQPHQHYHSYQQLHGARARPPRDRSGPGTGTGLPQPQEQPCRRRAVYGELNGSIGERETPLRRPAPEDPVSQSSSSYSNGSQQHIDTTYSPKHPIQDGSTFLGRSSLKTKNIMQKNVVDKKIVKAYEYKPKDYPAIEKSKAVPVLNGIVTNDSGCVANGYAGQTAENDGSGSESGYNTPKKYRARRNSEDLDLLHERVMQLDAANLGLTQDHKDFKTETFLDPEGNRLAYTKAAWRYEAGRGKPGSAELLRNNSDAKLGLGKKVDERPKGKQLATGAAHPAASKEDSWTLFKPPPVFPVDNSSAKIVPKISYASKVKENLHKVARAPSVLLCSSSSSSSSSSTGETPLQTSSRLSHVPMSAMKSVTSASFSNGPVLAGTDGNSYPAGSQPILASSVAPASSEAAPKDTSPVAVATEQKPSLFIYPSSMQSVLVSVAPADLSVQTNQQSLGDIFQNQWGLSFINEPSAGPDSAAGKPMDEEDLAFQEEFPDCLLYHSADTNPSGAERAVFPKAYELDKRTSSPVLSSLLKSGVVGLEAVLSHEPCHIGELQKADPGSPDVLVFLSKDYEIDSLRASPTNVLLASAKEQRCPGGLEENLSCGTFDPRAAIIYHTREMESIWHLQKQDPKRIITYNEAMDRAAH